MMSLATIGALAPATVRFCERRLDGLIAEPANTWSSLGYVLVGLWLLVGRRARGALVVVAVAELGIGMGSLALHATATFAGEVLDLTGMFLLSATLFALGVGRLARLSDATVIRLWLVAVAAPLALLAIVRPSGIASFAVVLAAGIIAEIVASRRDPSFRVFLTALGIFIVAFAIWVLDVTRLVCVPDNHILGGHAVWHLLNAWSIERLFAYYARSRAAAGG